MKLVEMKCPNCGAELKVDISKGRAFCQYCGTELLIDDEVKKVAVDDPENLGYHFEKGRQRAEKEGKKNRLPIILGGITVIVICTILVLQFSGKKETTQSSSPTISQNNNTQNNPNNAGETIASGDDSATNVVNESSPKYSAENFEVKMEEFKGDRITYYYFTIKNNCGDQALCAVNATGFDSAGNPIDVATESRCITEPGETGFARILFFDKEIDHIEYDIAYSHPTVSMSVSSQVEKKITVNDDLIIATITNNSSKPLNITSINAIFRDNTGAIVGEADEFFQGDDVPVGGTSNAKIICPNNNCRVFVDNGSIDYYYQLTNYINR